MQAYSTTLLNITAPESVCTQTHKPTISPDNDNLPANEDEQSLLQVSKLAKITSLDSQLRRSAD